MPSYASFIVTFTSITVIQYHISHLEFKYIIYHEEDIIIEKHTNIIFIIMY
jgi:hypothetical protein